MSFLKNTTTVCILVLIVIGLVIFFGVRSNKAKAPEQTKSPAPKPSTDKQADKPANAFRFK